MSRISKKKRAVKPAPEQIEKLISEQGLLSYAMAEFSRVTLTAAVERMCDTIKGAQSWGEERGFARAGLIRVPIERPRVRADGRELAIPEYDLLQRKSEFDEATRRAVMGGLTTRQFGRVGEALGVSTFGTRRLLGLWAGTTESREVVGSMFDDLKGRGLNPKLFVIDGSRRKTSSLGTDPNGQHLQRPGRERSARAQSMPFHAILAALTSQRSSQLG
jgi:hypothetical protein